MSTQILVHLEQAPETGFVWWAEARSIPGLSVAADTLADLYALALEAVDRLLGSEARQDVRFDLAPDAPTTAGDELVANINGAIDAARGSSVLPARRAVLTAA